MSIKLSELKHFSNNLHFYAYSIIDINILHTVYPGNMNQAYRYFQEMSIKIKILILCK